MGLQRFIFSDGQQEIELQHAIEITGLGIPPVDINSTKPYRQDGINVQHVNYQERPFAIKFDIKSATYEAAAAERRTLTRFFAASNKPKTFRYIRGDWGMYLSPVYLGGAYDSNMQEVSVIPGIMQFVAANPWFKRDIAPTSAMLEIPLLEYPESGLEWVEGGIEFSNAENELMLRNNGDVEADTVIRFVGPAEVPYIKNRTTGERIEVERTIAAGDVLEINSATGRVDIIDNTGRHNAFNFITAESDFIHLAPGENQIEFGSGGGALGYVEIAGVEYYAGI